MENEPFDAQRRTRALAWTTSALETRIIGYLLTLLLALSVAFACQATCPQGAFAAAPGVLGNNTGISLYTEIPEDKVESISFADSQAAPGGSITWDASAGSDGSVRGWAVDTDGDGLYEVTYGGNGAYPSAPSDAQRMFEGFSNLTSLNLAGLDTSTVTSMYGMFHGCSSLKSLDLSGLNTTNVTDMRVMFSSCSALATLDLSGFDTSKVTRMTSMFASCTSLAALDLSSFDTSNVTDMGDMFANANKLQEVTLGANFKWMNNTGHLPAPSASYIGGADGKWYDAATGIGYAPADVPSGKAATYKASRGLVAPIPGVVKNDGGIALGTDIAKDQVESISFTNQGAPEDIDTWDASEAGDGSVLGWAVDADGDGLFEVTYDRNGAYPSAPNDAKEMFAGFSKLATVDFAGFTTANATNMARMFYGCSALGILDLSGFSTTNVTDMGAMFSGCSSLTYLGVSDFDTAKVADMGAMFYGCSSLTYLNLSNFDTSSVESAGMIATFSGMNNLRRVVLGKNFTWVGDAGYLPAPSANYIDGADGKWYDAKTRVGYEPEDVPGNKTAVYEAVLPESGAVENEGKSGISLPTGVFKLQVESISFVNHQNAPAESITWDASEAGDGSVLGWAVDTDEDELYEVTYGGNGIYPFAPKDSRALFSNFSELVEIDLSNFDTSRVTDMRRMFFGCSSLTALDLSNFDTSNVESMMNMFSRCSSLETLNLSSFNVSNATMTSGMLSNCSSLAKLTLGEDFAKQPSQCGLGQPNDEAVEPGFTNIGVWVNESTGDVYPTLSEIPAGAGTYTPFTPIMLGGNPYSYKVHFDANASDATGQMADMTLLLGRAKALTANAFAREGYAFKEWNTEPDGSGEAYAGGTEVRALSTKPGATVTLYAQWTEEHGGSGDGLESGTGQNSGADQSPGASQSGTGTTLSQTGDGAPVIPAALAGGVALIALCLSRRRAML